MVAVSESRGLGERRHVDVPNLAAELSRPKLTHLRRGVFPRYGIKMRTFFVNLSGTAGVQAFVSCF